LVTPFNLSVPAGDAFYVACRNDMKAMPIVRVFVDWLFSEHPWEPGVAEMPMAGQISIRKRRSVRA
jgi:LysR family glycine cleavage system transcriptional activator